jgi:hypothetical protein
MVEIFDSVGPMEDGKAFGFYSGTLALQGIVLAGI